MGECFDRRAQSVRALPVLVLEPSRASARAAWVDPPLPVGRDARHWGAAACGVAVASDGMLKWFRGKRSKTSLDYPLHHPCCAPTRRAPSSGPSQKNAASGSTTRCRRADAALSNRARIATESPGVGGTRPPKASAPWAHAAAFTARMPAQNPCVHQEPDTMSGLLLFYRASQHNYRRTTPGAAATAF